MDYKGWISQVGDITLQDLIEDLKPDPTVGAITTFTGITRSLSDKSNLRVIKLEVEAWEDQTSKSMQKIAEEVGKNHNLIGLRIVHLEGEIAIGEPIVFVVIASIHRKEAFTALEEAIERYKHDSPVWKKEIYADGSGQWISTSRSEQ